MKKGSDYHTNIQRLIDEANIVPVNSTDYWRLRATYIEKSLDTTYSGTERDNCYMLWRILMKRQ